VVEVVAVVVYFKLCFGAVSSAILIPVAVEDGEVPAVGGAEAVLVVAAEVSVVASVVAAISVAVDQEEVGEV
jgi:hypothetical protein